MVTITNTQDIRETGKVNLFIYGRPSTRKTLSIATLPNPIILSSEKGLLSLRDYNIPVIEVKTLAEVYEACAFVENSEYESVAIDSISEITAILLDEEEDLALKEAKEAKGAKAKPNGQAPYGEILKKITKLARRFRDLPQHVYMIAKAEKTQLNEDSRKKWGPSLRGNKLGDALCHDFDQILAARTEIGEDGQPCYFFQTREDNEWTARDRSGVLDEFEPQDLGAIIEKILRGVK